MINILLILNFLFIVIGFIAGYNWRDLSDRLKALEEKPKPDVGATSGSYGKVNEYMVNQPGKVGLVMPKTPQQMAWEEEEQLRQANESK